MMLLFWRNFLVLFAFFLGLNIGLASAQDVKRYETFGDALNGLLSSTGGGTPNDPTCGLLQDEPPYPDPAKGNLLSVDAETAAEFTAPEVDPPKWVEGVDYTLRTGLIGINLSRHCYQDSNLVGGSVVGGSLSSLQPTRTVSQFDVKRTKPADVKKMVPTTGNFVEATKTSIKIVDANSLLMTLTPIQNL